MLSSFISAIITQRYKEKVNDKGETPLHVAAIKGDLKVVKALVDQVLY